MEELNAKYDSRIVCGLASEECRDEIVVVESGEEGVGGNRRLHLSQRFYRFERR